MTLCLRSQICGGQGVVAGFLGESPVLPWTPSKAHLPSPLCAFCASLQSVLLRLPVEMSPKAREPWNPPGSPLLTREAAISLRDLLRGPFITPLSCLHCFSLPDCLLQGPRRSARGSPSTVRSTPLHPLGSSRGYLRVVLGIRGHGLPKSPGVIGYLGFLGSGVSWLPTSACPVREARVWTFVWDTVRVPLQGFGSICLYVLGLSRGWWTGGSPL